MSSRSLKERVAALETLVNAGKIVDTAASLAALNARSLANEKAGDHATQMIAQTQARADDVLTKRFDAANEVRGAMKDAERQFVTRQEFQWAIGTVILVLIALLIRMLTGK